MTTEAVWRALGTSVHLLVDDGDIRVAREAVEATLARVDATYSRFRADSELSRLNARPGEPVPISDLMARAVRDALRAAAATDGLVDPTVGRAVRATGYDADFAAVRAAATKDGEATPRPPFVVRLERVPGWRAVRFDAATRTVTLPRGVELDLGSTGKALAAELSAASAAERLGPRTGVFVSLGGDVAIAGRVPAGGWRIAVGEASGADPRDLLEVVALTAGGLATSSTTVRRWRHGGVAAHHIVDPRTGAPAAGPWRTATVVAATCSDANAAATAAIVRGADAPEWLAALGLAARLVATGGSVVFVGGWPAPSASTPRVGGRPSPAVSMPPDGLGSLERTAA